MPSRSIVRARLLPALALLPLLAAVFPRDIEGSRDHPLFPRFPQSVILHYEDKVFDEHRVALGRIRSIAGEFTIGKSARAEGRVTRILYRIPDDASTFHVYRSFETSLASAGFETLFSCENDTCELDGPIRGQFGRALHPRPSGYERILAGIPKSQRYLAATRRGAHKTLHVTVYVVEHNYLSKDIDLGRMAVELVVVESQSGLPAAISPPLRAAW